MKIKTFVVLVTNKLTGQSFPIRRSLSTDDGETYTEEDRKLDRKTPPTRYCSCGLCNTLAEAKRHLDYCVCRA
jgi:hypothetical protein